MKGRASKACRHHESLSQLAGFGPSVKHLALNLSAFGFMILASLCLRVKRVVTNVEIENIFS